MASTTARPHAVSAGSRPSQSRQKLGFNEAMHDFKSMFPSIEDEVIETVLRAKNGSVDATIDHLIAMGAGDDADAASKSNETGAGATPPTCHNEVVIGPSRCPIRRQWDAPASSSSSSTVYYQRISASGFNPPLVGPLPEDFLRIRLPKPRRYRPSSLNRLLSESGRGVRSSPSAVLDVTPEKRMQILEDERVALYLQNEEFMKELRRNREFIESLERDQTRNHMLLVYPPKNRHPTATRPPKMHRNYNNQQRSNPHRTHNTAQLALTRNVHPVASLPSPDYGGEAPSQLQQQHHQVARRERYHDQEGSPLRDQEGSPAPEQVTTLHGLGFEAEAVQEDPLPVERKHRHEEVTFNEKLKHMSKTTKKKFHRLAQLFVRRKKKQTLGAFEAASTANLLNSEVDFSPPEELPASQELSPDIEYGEEPVYSQDFYPGASANEPVEFYSEDFYSGHDFPDDEDC